MQYYTVAGSRKTPVAVLETMRQVAKALDYSGYVLRTCASHGPGLIAYGASQEATGLGQRWVPWLGFDGHFESIHLPDREHFRLAQALRNDWHILPNATQAMKACNVAELLGVGLDQPSRFLLCYSACAAQSPQELTRHSGATGELIRLADYLEIPVVNFARDDALQRLYTLKNQNKKTQSHIFQGD